MISNNPLLKKMFQRSENEHLDTILKPMTIEGTANKFFLLLTLLLISAAYIWNQFTLGRTDLVFILGIAGMIFSVILTFIVSFKPTTGRIISPIFAICKGAFVGSFSCVLESQFPGIVMKAVIITIIAAFTVGIMFKMEIIRATEKFKTIIVSATIAIFLFYLIAFILWLCGINLSYFNLENTPLYTLLNIGIAILATLNLVLDFDFIKRGVEEYYPEHFEWFGAHGLVITIVWMYIEIIRILARLIIRD